MIIKCCRHCVPPKRYPGCHATCPEYIEESGARALEREAIYKSKQNARAADDVASRAVDRINKKKRRR